jgi:hypothetical protein
MERRSRTLLALEILKEYSCDERYLHLSEDRIDSVAADILHTARQILLEDARAIVEEILALGFNKTEIAGNIKVDCGTISRAQNRIEEVQMGLPKLQGFVSKLRAFRLYAREQRLNLLLPLNQLPLAVLDFCTSRTINDETSSEIGRIVFMNLISCLTDKLDKRLALPEEVKGCLVQFGPPEFGLFGFQLERTAETSEVQQLKDQIHELKHILARKKAELTRKEKDLASKTPERQNQLNRPKSLYS